MHAYAFHACLCLSCMHARRTASSFKPRSPAQKETRCALLEASKQRRVTASQRDALIHALQLKGGRSAFAQHLARHRLIGPTACGACGRDVVFPGGGGFGFHRGCNPMIELVSVLKCQGIVSSEGCCSLCFAADLHSGTHACNCRFTTSYVVDDTFRCCNFSAGGGGGGGGGAKARQLRDSAAFVLVRAGDQQTHLLVAPTLLPLGDDMGLFSVGGLSSGQLVGYYTGVRVRVNTPGDDPGLVVNKSTATLPGGASVSAIWCVSAVSSLLPVLLYCCLASCVLCLAVQSADDPMTPALVTCRDPRKQGGVLFLANGGHGHVVNMTAEDCLFGDDIPITRLGASKRVGAASELLWDYGAACGKEEEEIKCCCHPACTRNLVQFHTLADYRKAKHGT